MAHYVAEQISAAESASDNDLAGKQQAVAESILALWQRRSGLPTDRPPMQAFERVFLALDRLAEPGDPWGFYRLFPKEAEPSAEDVASETLLRLALNLEDSAREIVRALVVEAAATALNQEAEWVRLTENLSEDEERKALRRLNRLARLSNERLDDPEDMEPLERAHAHIARMIKTLTTINEAIADELQGKPPQ
jgi:hypothetical protein